MAISKSLDSDLVRLACDRTLSGHRRQTVRETLASLAASPYAELPPDFYGNGGAISRLETDVASLLGKPAAMFTVKGVVAQQAALRSWTDRTGCPNVVLHPKSHIDVDEHAAYQVLHGLRPIRLGSDHAPFVPSDLAAVAEAIGAVIVELPLRRAGYRLPAWEQLCAISVWCRDRAVPFHVDGARLWEAQPFYGRTLAEIAALADSVYVSFYKGLGGVGGAVLCGPEALIATARVWHARHCGPLMTAWPLVIGALDGLARHLPRMSAYAERARTLAAALTSLSGVCVAPDPPQTNAFHLYLPAPPAALQTAHVALAAQTRVWLFRRFDETPLPGLTMTEVTIGDAIDDLTEDEILDLVDRLLGTARG